MKKAYYFALLALCIPYMVSCGGKSDDEDIDPTKSQLRVMNFNGGYGNEWLENIIARFEEQYKDVSFEEGKKGVQIHPDPQKTKGNGLNLSTSSNDVFFTEEVPYFSFASQGKLLQLDDVVEQVTSQPGVSLSTQQIEALTALDGHYYALPHYETSFGFIYDKDLFDEEQLYISSDHDSYIGYDVGDLSEGPDGIDGTNDDGLPSTMKEFFELCDEMVIKGITPFVVTGGSAGKYTANIVNRVAAAYCGYDVTLANYTFNCENVEVITDISSIVEDPTSPLGYSYNSEKVTITNENGYLMRQTVGKLYGFSFLNKIINGNGGRYLYKDALSSGTTQLDAQEYFIYSKPMGRNPIAMLIDGIWWETEATEKFNSCAKTYPNTSKQDRNFGLMPIPTKIDENDTNSSGNPYCAYDMYNAYVFAKYTTDENKINLIKEFIKFCYSQDELVKFTKTVGIPKAMSYNIGTAYDELSSYQKDIWDSHISGYNVKQLSNNRLYYENETKLDSLTILASQSYTYPYAAFSLANPVSVLTYFQGTFVTKDKWNSNYSKYFAN